MRSRFQYRHHNTFAACTSGLAESKKGDSSRAISEPFANRNSAIGVMSMPLQQSKGGLSRDRPADPEPLHFVNQGRTRHAKLCGCALRSAHHPTAVFKCTQD